jgi:hypothetical protein
MLKQAEHRRENRSDPWRVGRWDDCPAGRSCRTDAARHRADGSNESPTPKPPFDLKGELLLGVEVLWDELLEAGVASRTLTQQVRIQATQDPAAVVVNRVVAPWISLKKVGATVADANQKLALGQINEAVAALDKTILELSQYGERGEEAIKVLRDMKGKITNGERSLRNMKSSKFASHNFMRMSSKERLLREHMNSSSKPNPPGDGLNPKI